MVHRRPCRATSTLTRRSSAPIADLASSAAIVVVGDFLPVDDVDLRLFGTVIERSGRLVDTGYKRTWEDVELGTDGSALKPTASWWTIGCASRLGSGQPVPGEVMSSSAGEPSDPAGVVVARMIGEFVVERGDGSADERVVAMSWERVIGEQQQTEVGPSPLEAGVVAAQEVGDVVGDNGPPVCGGVVEQDAVIDAAQVCQAAILHGHHVVTPIAELPRHGGRQHLVEQQPHSSTACWASYRRRASAASRCRRSICRSISTRNSV